MYNYEDLKVIHLEITERCNASCPQCGRNINGGEENPYLHDAELSLDDCKRIFPINFVKQLNRMYMCGNFGDPAIAKDTLSVYEYFRKYNPTISLGMNTNGSIRKTDWWKELARIQNGHGRTRFSIDGLEDTNHIYRIGTQWDKLIENATAYIQEGGYAIWDFIVFSHNEHQVEEARELSNQLGFKEFVVKKTGRFYSNTLSKGKDKHIGKDRKGKDIVLEKPKSNEYQNKSLSKEEQIVKKFGSLDNYFDQVEIDCKVAKEKNIYISAEGLALPCCWTANQMYVWYWKEQQGQIWQLINKVGKDNLNAKINSLREVVDGPFFQKYIVDSWNAPNCKNGKLKVCAKTCGINFDPFGDQFK